MSLRAWSSAMPSAAKVWVTSTFFLLVVAVAIACPFRGGCPASSCRRIAAACCMERGCGEWGCGERGCGERGCGRRQAPGEGRALAGAPGSSALDRTGSYAVVPPVTLLSARAALGSFAEGGFLV